MINLKPIIKSWDKFLASPAHCGICDVDGTRAQIDLEHGLFCLLKKKKRTKK